MKFEARLTGEASTLARPHAAMLERLPATLPRVDPDRAREVGDAVRRRARLPARAPRAPRRPAGGRARAPVRGGGARRDRSGLRPHRDARRRPRSRTRRQAALRKRRLLARWRQEVDAVFQAIQPALDARLHPPTGRDGSSSRSTPAASRCRPSSCGAASAAGAFACRWRSTAPAGRTPSCAACSAAATRARGATLFAGVGGAADATPLDAWIVESGEALHACTRAGRVRRGGRRDLDRPELRPPPRLSRRPDAARSTRRSRPASRARRRSPPTPAACASRRGRGALRHAPEVVQAFVRDLFLTGNGTLFVNNTFVEWAAVQAIRRAQPRLLVARYGVRDKMKPFSSLLLFSQPRASDQIPEIEDPVGSFVDVEQLSHYVWLNAEKSAGLSPAHAASPARRGHRRRCWRFGRARPPPIPTPQRRGRRPRPASPTSAPRWRSGSACRRRPRAGPSRALLGLRRRTQRPRTGEVYDFAHRRCPTSDPLRFVTAADAVVEPSPWGPHEWLSRAGLTAAEQLMLVRVTHAAGQGPRLPSAPGDGGDHLRRLGPRRAMGRPRLAHARPGRDRPHPDGRRPRHLQRRRRTTWSSSPSSRRPCSRARPSSTSPARSRGPRCGRRRRDAERRCRRSSSPARSTPRAPSTPTCAIACARRGVRRAGDGSRRPRRAGLRAGHPGGGRRPRRRRRSRARCAPPAIAARPSTPCCAAPARWCPALHADGRIDGVLGLGGGGGTAMITAAMRTLPVGVPKLMVSTLASGNTAPYVDVTDITLMPSVVDIAGLNPAVAADPRQRRRRHRRHGRQARRRRRGRATSRRGRCSPRRCSASPRRA